MAIIEPEQAGQPPQDRLDMLETGMYLLDRSENNYFDACADFLEKPTEQGMDTLNNATQDHCDAFKMVVQLLGDDVSSQEMLPLYAGMIKGGDERRTSFINAVVGEEITQPLGDEFDLKLIGEPDELDEDELRDYIIAFVSEAFNDYIASDTDRLYAAADCTRAAKLLRLKYEIRGNAATIGKFALGAFIGTWLARKLSR